MTAPTDNTAPARGSFTHRFDPGILRAYDIRGEIGTTLREEDCYAVGRAFGTVVARGGGRSVALGFDGRETSPAFADAVIDGLLKTGLDVHCVGLGPSPMVYFGLHHLKADASVVVTGSHSPVTHNGIKMALAGRPFYGADVQKLGVMAAAGDLDSGSGTRHNHDIYEAYTDRLVRDYDCDAELSVAWDIGNGAGGAIIQMLTEKLPGKHTILFGDVDGTFPNHHPDPTVAKNLVDLQNAVRKNGCDAGIGFDGDADRIGAVYENGEILWADILLALYAAEVLETHPGAHVIADVKCSRVLFDEIARLGGKPVMWQTGHSVIKAKMKELNAPLAGELAGHICFADKFYGFDDGPYCAVRLLNLIGKSGKKFSELTAHLPQMHNTPEMRFHVPEERKFEIPQEILRRLQNEKKDGWEICDIDGIRLTAPEGWFLLRASNTESVLTARVESFDAEGLEMLQSVLAKYLAAAGAELPV
ncbi:MAG: phosphomannomutase/phosphoglucomutase [Micavibrio sp.]|nr:MAG: phosphomannomutase/phosphoglucomutase [Micavibrio sp.]